MWELLLPNGDINLENLNEENIVEYFSVLLEDSKKKKKIVIEVANRILSLFPITHHDQEAIKSWNPNFTTIDDMIWNSLWKYMVDDIVSNNGGVFLKRCNINVSHRATSETSIPKEVLLDIVRVVFLWQESKIKDKVPIDEAKIEVLTQVEDILNIW